MPKFGKTWFNGYYFGDDTPAFTNFYNSIHRIPLGMEVRKQLAKSVIFRIRRGNGHAGSTKGRRYQDKYKYFVPSSINNVESDPYRTNWKTAIDYWQNILTADEKKEYNRRSKKGLRISGYNLFIREAMRGIYKMFVNRGDPANYDFTLTDFTTDGNWHDLDLSGIIPATARALLFEVEIDNNVSNKHAIFKKYGQTNDINHFDAETKLATPHESYMGILAVDGNRKISYKIDSSGWSDFDFIVRGWWT